MVSVWSIYSYYFVDSGKKGLIVGQYWLIMVDNISSSSKEATNGRFGVFIFPLKTGSRSELRLEFPNHLTDCVQSFWGLPSGKLSHNYALNHHAIDGKTHELWIGPCSIASC